MRIYLKKQIGQRKNHDTITTRRENVTSQQQKGGVQNGVASPALWTAVSRAH